MPKNRPRCHCGGDTKRNGTTSKGTTRWRCKACGASVNKSRPDGTKAATFAQFIEYCTTTTSLSALAKQNGVSTSTMKRRFSWCWLVDVPDPTIGHTGRIYDQIFIDGTYTASAIKQCWPSTVIQRCLVHAQRVVRRYTTSRPRTDAGRTIYQLALKLTRISTIDQASQWGAQLHEFATVYHTWLNEKSFVKDPQTTSVTSSTSLLLCGAVIDKLAGDMHHLIRGDCTTFCII